MTQQHNLKGRVFLGLFTVGVLLFGGITFLMEGRHEVEGFKTAMGGILLAMATFRSFKIYMDVQGVRRRSRISRQTDVRGGGR